jgi:RNA polymerase sigma-70 factor (TIGR02943 family)
VLFIVADPTSDVGSIILSAADDSQTVLADPERWVDEYGDYLYRYAWSRLRDESAADEVLQETFLAGIRFQDRFTGDGAERAWLLGILKRKLIDHIRMRNRYDRDGSYEDTNDPSSQLFDQKGNWRAESFAADTPDGQLESKEIWDVVKICLQNIPKGQADVFMLSVMEDMDSDQICSELGISASNLWVRLHRARLALAKCVGARWFQNEGLTQHA